MTPNTAWTTPHAPREVGPDFREATDGDLAVQRGPREHHGRESPARPLQRAALGRRSHGARNRHSVDGPGWARVWREMASRIPDVHGEDLDRHVVRLSRCCGTGCRWCSWSAALSRQRRMPRSAGSRRSPPARQGPLRSRPRARHSTMPSRAPTSSQNIAARLRHPVCCRRQSEAESPWRSIASSRRRRRSSSTVELCGSSAAARA